MQDAFKKADDVLMHAVQGIAQTISSEGVINIDFNDIRTAMTAKGHAMMGIGRASGEDRARQATEKAIRSPLLDDLLLENAKGLIVNVVSSESVTLDELNEITEVVNDITDIEEANIFIGTVIDEKLGEDLHVTVIATGLTLDDSETPQPMPSASSAHTVDRSTHTSAFHAQQKSQPQPQQPASPASPTGTSQPAATKTNSIQDYLKRQQNR